MPQDDRDLEDFADKNKKLLEETELSDENFGDGDDIIDITPEPSPELEPEPESTPKEDKIKLEEEALIALGFKLYDNREQGKKYTMILWHKGIHIKLGKTFKLNGQHFWWAFQKDSDPDDPNRMFKSDVIAKIPVVHLYNEIMNGAAEIPAKTLIGHVHKRVGKSLVIEFESSEQYEEKGARFGEGAVKFDADGKCILASFSAATKDQSAKMKVPRCIRLPDYEQEMGSVPKKEKNTIPLAGHILTQEQQSKKEENIIDDQEKEIIQRVARKLEACVPYASEIVERKFERYGLSNEQKAELTEKVMMYIAINATKEGL